MRKTLALISALVLLSPLVGHAQDGRAALENVAKAMGATALKSITYTGSGQTLPRRAERRARGTVAPAHVEEPDPGDQLRSSLAQDRAGRGQGHRHAGAGRSRLVTRGRSSW